MHTINGATAKAAYTRRRRGGGVENGRKTRMATRESRRTLEGGGDILI